MNRNGKVVQSRLALNRLAQPGLRVLRMTRQFHGDERDNREITGKGRVGNPKDNGRRR